MTEPHCDVAIIGGGIVGLATAMALAEPGSLSVVVLEAEDHLAAHQSGHNTGIIHSGIFYRPGTLKARLCVEGRDALYEFCANRGVAHKRCGKVIVATRERDLPGLNELERWAAANGLRGVRRLDPSALREYEPHVGGIAGLHVPEAGVVDYADVTRAFGDRFRELGGTVQLQTRVESCRRFDDGFVLSTSGCEVRCRALVNCAGLQSDRVARMCGTDPGAEVIPFRGQFYEVVPGRRELVRALIYPVPDLRLPFLGQHLTRNIHGTVEADPNGALVLNRHAYWQSDPVCLRDALEMLAYSGFWLVILRHFGTGVKESLRASSRRVFAAALRRMVPELRPEDLRRTRAGVHAQAVKPDGTLVDDFRILTDGRAVHVLSATSPAATSSIALGRVIAGKIQEQLGLDRTGERPQRAPEPSV